MPSRQNEMPPYKKGFYLESAYCRTCGWRYDTDYEDAIIEPLETDVWTFTKETMHPVCLHGMPSNLRVCVRMVLYE